MSAEAALLGLLPALLLVMGYPIFLVLLTACTAMLIFQMSVPLMVLQQTLFNSLNAYALLALPFFILAGELMDRGGIARRLVDMVDASLGRVPAKRPLTAVGTGAILGAITGVGAASVATVGKVIHPSLTEEDYDESFIAGLLVSVGAVGVILPPSIPMIVYAAAADESIPRLYAAGLGPGALILVLLSAYCIWHARHHGRSVTTGFSFRRFWTALKGGIWALGVPAVILGGIYGGIFSPTEAAAVACVYALLVTLLILRDAKPKDALDAARSTVRFTSQILIVVACAGVFSWIITVNQVPAAVVEAMTGAGLPAWALLLAINMILLLLGCVLDPLSAILLLTPLLLPIVAAVGIDPIHFGMIVTANLAIGLFTPPFGINIFVLQTVFGTPLSKIYKGVVPFFFLYLIALGVVTFVPALSLIGPTILISASP